MITIMKLLSYPIFRRDDWILRVSILGSESILVTMFNELTTETIVRSFTDELQANLYIEYAIHKHLLKDEPNE
jgi:hypothetical protein